MDNNKREENAVGLAIEYLKAMQDGRIKPDKFQKFPTIRDSIDNTENIKHIKKLLDNYFTCKLKCEDGDS